MTDQGWTLNIQNLARVSVLSNVFIDAFNVEYDSASRYGTIEMELTIPEEQNVQLHDYIESVVQNTATQITSLKIEIGNQTINYENVVLTSITHDYTQNQKTEMTWNFVGDTFASPTKDKKQLKPENLEWKTYGF